MLDNDPFTSDNTQNLEIQLQENNLGSSLEFVETELIYKMNGKSTLFNLLWKNY